MNPYTLALGLALAGEAIAEEPKECIDSINLTVEIKPSVKTKGIEATIDSALQKVQDFYQREVQLPIMWKYQTQREPNDIHVTYGNVDDCMQDWFPTAEAVEEFAIRNASSQEEKNRYLQLQKQEGTLPDYEIKTVHEKRLKAMKYLLEAVGGFSDPPEDKIYAFSSTPYPLPVTVAHEISHMFFGKTHSSTNSLLNGKLNVMYRPLSEKQPLEEYGFSEEDKAKIKAQMCKPEEPK